MIGTEETGPPTTRCLHSSWRENSVPEKSKTKEGVLYRKCTPAEEPSVDSGKSPRGGRKRGLREDRSRHILIYSSFCLKRGKFFLNIGRSEGRRTWRSISQGRSLGRNEVWE